MIDSRGLGAVINFMVVASILGVVLGIWKLIEIGIWIWKHIDITIQ